MEIELARKKQVNKEKLEKIEKQKRLVEDKLRQVKLADEAILKLKRQTAEIMEQVNATLECGTILQPVPPPLAKGSRPQRSKVE